jgi:hypothetical protein
MSKNYIFPYEFKDSKIITNDLWWLKSDVTFRVDTFLYKKLFHRTSYAKVMTVLSEHIFFLQNDLKFMFVIFPN